MTDELLVKDKDVVVPGELLATGMGYLPSKGTYRLGDHIRAGKLGLVQVEGKVLKLVPLSGRYNPKVGDTIICQVIDVYMSGWKVSTNTAYSAVLSIADGSSEYIAKGADLTQYHDLGDYLVLKITNITSQKLIDVSMKGPGLKKLRGGRVTQVSPSKVPRIIGKHGSMLNLIKAATDCKIVVGQNGIVWLDGEPEKELLAVNTIKRIEENAHVSGLTDTIKTFLEKETGKKNLAELAAEKAKEAQEQNNQQRTFSRPPRQGHGNNRRQFRPRRQQG